MTFTDCSLMLHITNSAYRGERPQMQLSLHGQPIKREMTAELWIYVLLSYQCIDIIHAVLPLAPQMREYETEEEMLKTYVNEGYPYKSILLFLSLYHGIKWSLRTLKRRLKSFNIFRRKYLTPDATLEEKIRTELSGPCGNIGYREMWKLLNSKHQLRASKTKVMKLLQRLNPSGIERRIRCRLQRRIYVSNGPNFTWHIDGFDKLKPYGFAIHGAIDGFSRRILWLEVASSNSDPAVIGFYFLNCVKQLHGCPANARTDPGTENGILATIQTILTNDPNSHAYVTSVRNQRIEAWWSYFKRNRAQWWMDYFSDLYDSGVYDPDNRFQRSCFQFCFMDFIQLQLNETAVAWNCHRIRPNTGSCPPGIPNEIYFLPEQHSKSDFKIPVSEHDLEPFTQITKPKGRYDDMEVYEYLNLVKSRIQWREASNVEDALQNYIDMMRISGE